MTDLSELPKWVKDSQEQLKNITPKIESIKKHGQAEIRRGLEKVNEADKLQNESDYLGRVLKQPHESEYWDDEIINLSGVQLASSLSFLNQNVNRMANLADESGNIGDVEHSRFVFALPTTDGSSGTAIYLGASIESRFQSIEPEYKAILAKSELSRLTSRDALFQELKSALAAFGEGFTTTLDGSEAALGTNTPDSLHQASHSMRDCFQQLIEYLAPSKVVKSQPWFEPTDGAPGGVSRRSRLKYMLYGTGENVDESTLQQLDVLSEIAKESLDLCMARAHGHDPTLAKNEVILAIDQARNNLLNVLKLYNRFRKNNPSVSIDT